MNRKAAKGLVAGSLQARSDGVRGARGLRHTHCCWAGRLWTAADGGREAQGPWNCWAACTPVKMGGSSGRVVSRAASAVKLFDSGKESSSSSTARSKRGREHLGPRFTTTDQVSTGAMAKQGHETGKRKPLP
ncbi:hypothetical protein AAFF_G00155490 [Aldrovandia affinis]|uniref:Uncharacterized protein n=1 Tax=Aldrovandia affinis TaxID=143900 RepID=A0AAD7WW93_9TELE|nr:hypothetical protein AAFF_G00155490 [Aldrovandia affinis]